MQETIQTYQNNNCKTIEKAFISNNSGLTIQQIIDITKLARGTVKTYLDELVKMGRIHEEEYAQNTKVYFLNGVGKYQESILINKNEVLYVDVMTDPWKNPFIRVKYRNKGKDIGSIFLNNEEAINKLIEALSKTKPQLEKYRALISKLND